jgi:hypothetical protein
MKYKHQVEATTRALIAIASDMAELEESHARVRRQIEALATAHRVPLARRCPS